MLNNISILSKSDCHDGVDLGVDKIISGFMNVAKAVPHLLSTRASMGMHLLHGGDVLPDEHPDIGVIELPILGTNRISICVRASDTTINVAVSVSDAKVHGLGPCSPVLRLAI